MNSRAIGPLSVGLQRSRTRSSQTTVPVSRANHNRGSHRTILQTGRALRITNNRGIGPLSVGLQRSRTRFSQTTGLRIVLGRRLMGISLMTGRIRNQRIGQAIGL
jgi:hypothetical protein